MLVNDDRAAHADPNGLLRRANRRLGFGCGNLYAGGRRKNSVRLLESAIEMGVNYFDTARMYGHGQAEGLLGEVLPRHRAKLIVTSKCGILPERRSLVGQVARKAARLARRLPGLSSVVGDPGRPQPTFGVFDLPDVRKSVETSLRALRTDHINILLLHECDFNDATNPALIDLLHMLQAEGKIGTYGAATSVGTTLRLASERPDLMPVLQFPNTPADDKVRLVRNHTQAALVTHSVLGVAFGRFRLKLKDQPALRAQASGFGIDPDDAAELAKLMIALALQANPTGVVLFSTSKIDHLRVSLEAADVGVERLQGMARLVELEGEETTA